jgi:hypothetical protein
LHPKGTRFSAFGTLESPTYTATLLAESFWITASPFVAFDPIGVWRYLKVPPNRFRRCSCTLILLHTETVSENKDPSSEPGDKKQNPTQPDPELTTPLASPTLFPTEPKAVPKSPIEAVITWLWPKPAGRALAVIALAAQAIDPIVKVVRYFATPKAANKDVPVYVKDGYYVDSRRTVFELGGWRDVLPAQENVKTSLAVCYNTFTIYREKDEAVNFVHRISSTAKVAPEVFCDRMFTVLPVEGYTEMGKARQWEIRIDISHEASHRPITLQFVILFWNNFNQKSQWDAGSRIYNSRTDHAEIEIRFPHWKPIREVKYEMRSITGDKAQPPEDATPDPNHVQYERTKEGDILGVTWTLEQPVVDKTYWMTWDWSSTA